MNTVLSFFLILAVAQGEIDWNNVVPNHLQSPSGVPVRDNATSSRIVGGTESIPHSRPYQVGMVIPVPGGATFCGGSLISKRTVLTAAHCVDRATGPVLIILGAHKIRKREPSQVRMRSSDIIIHPKWDRSLLRNDIALIILPSEVESDDNISIIELPPKDSNADYTDKDATVSGWGRVSDGKIGISPVLREVTLPIITNFWCNVVYFGVIAKGHICASGSGGKSSCNGDSGGPLVIDEVQVGIVSFGIRFGCEVGWPAVFTRVTYYNDWIRKNMIDEY